MLSNGMLHITEEVLAIITSVCINEFEGIKVTSSSLKESIVTKITKSYTRRGITIEHHDNEITVGVKVSFNYGSNIFETCKNLQKAIKTEVEALSGFTIKQVDISVDHIMLNENKVSV
jgi:uncharacterized alkaline shock family protein YloU